MLFVSDEEHARPDARSTSRSENGRFPSIRVRGVLEYLRRCNATGE